MTRPDVVHDVSPAEWIDARLWTWPRPEGGVLVGCTIPEGFETYARIFHPIQRQRRDGTWEQVRWSTIAEENGRTAHADMLFHRIAVPSGVDGDPDFGGSSPRELCESVARIAERFTSTPESCWFGLWSGYGESEVQSLGAPTFGSAFSRSTGREYYLFHGSVGRVTDFDFGLSFLSPNFWWPQDRSWCVATEIDHNWTYVGGSRACVEALLRAPDLEALETRIDARHDWEGDRINT
jgi:hypothetical protein